MNNIEPVLTEIADALNSSDITWGVGASVLLSRYGLVENPTDIDIIVSVSDVHKADSILSLLGKKKSTINADTVYATDYFYEYVIDGVNVDVMAGFKIRLPDAVFEYTFDQTSVPNYFPFKNISVPFTTLEDWYVLYQLMPEKENKVALLADYFFKHGIQYPYIFERMRMNPTLPESVKHNIEELL